MSGWLGQLELHQIGDLLAGEHGDAEQRRPLHDGPDDAIDEGEPPQDGRLGGGLELADEAQEQARVAGLLAELVEDVGDARVEQVVAAQDLVGEPDGRRRLEADAGEQDGQLFAAEPGELIVGELEAEPLDRQQLDGHDQAVADVPGHGLVGFEHAGGRHGGQALETALGGEARRRGDRGDDGCGHERISLDFKIFVNTLLLLRSTP